MNRIYFRLASVPCAVLLLTVTGCVSRAPNLDSHFGEAVSLVKAQQTLNPDASRNNDPVRGMDAKAAKSAYDQYQKAYRAPDPQPNVFTIGIGGSR
jgi:predicted component of type VI protein secretion system